MEQISTPRSGNVGATLLKGFTDQPFTPKLVEEVVGTEPENR